MNRGVCSHGFGHALVPQHTLIYSVCFIGEISRENPLSFRKLNWSNAFITIDAHNKMFMASRFALHKIPLNAYLKASKKDNAKENTEKFEREN